MAQIPEHIFREYDIRGIADSELTPGVVEAIGKAYGTWLQRQKISRVVVGGDIRMSTPRIIENVTAGLRSVGINVINIGRVTTPAFYWSMLHLESPGGVMVTGSHNPKEMNGLKLGIGKVTLYGEQIQEILRIIKEKDFGDSFREGTLEERETCKAYLDMLISKLDFGPRRLKVVGGRGKRRCQPSHERLFRQTSLRLHPPLRHPGRHLPQPPSGSHGTGKSGNPHRKGASGGGRFRRGLRR